MIPGYRNYIAFRCEMVSFSGRTACLFMQALIPGHFVFYFDAQSFVFPVSVVPTQDQSCAYDANAGSTCACSIQNCLFRCTSRRNFCRPFSYSISSFLRMSIYVLTRPCICPALRASQGACINGS